MRFYFFHLFSASIKRGFARFRKVVKGLQPGILIFFSIHSFLISEESSSMIICIKNGRVVKDHEIRREDLWICEGKFIEPAPAAGIVIDMQDSLIAPGYIDIQINGGFGIDFSRDPEQVNVVARLLPQYGVTAFLPTIVTSAREQYPKALSLLSKHMASNSLNQSALILGIHLEGPCINQSFKGAHQQDDIVSFSEAGDCESFYGSLSHIRLVTLAPELPGAGEWIETLRQKNIVVAAGHTAASFEEMLAAEKKGVKLVTHLFNAMQPFHHRAPGVAGAALGDFGLYYSMIVDGVHLHFATVKMAWRANPKGLVLVSDAMAALGLPDGVYQLGSKNVEVSNGKAYLFGLDTLAGSVVSLDQAVRNLRQYTGCSIVEAIEAASLKPAEVLGIENVKGSLNIGSDADFIVMDDDLYITESYIGGRLVWSKK